MEKPVRAWVRRPTDSYGQCLREDRRRAIDAARARAQHARYVEALRAEAITVVEIEADEAYPDGCFVEDAAVVWDGGGVLTSMAAPSRRGEGEAVGRALAAAGIALDRMPASAHLDGGDVLRVGARLVAGRSRRTNEAGIEALRRSAGRRGIEVVAVDVRAGLHLKSAVTLLDERTALVHGDAVDRAALARALGVELLEAPEPFGANVVALGQTVLLSAAAPRTRALIEARGLRVVELEVDELHAGDGALTCLSLREPAPGAFCA